MTKIQVVNTKSLGGNSAKDITPRGHMSLSTYPGDLLAEEPPAHRPAWPNSQAVSRPTLSVHVPYHSYSAFVLFHRKHTDKITPVVMVRILMRLARAGHTVIQSSLQRQANQSATSWLLQLRAAHPHCPYSCLLSSV